MKFFRDHIYHIYNRGNDGSKIFFVPDNYNFFLKKVSMCFKNNSHVLSFCLMPNHFHLLILVLSEEKKIPRRIGTMLSSYTQAVNKKNGKTGSLFQQNTKSKCIENIEYAETCFHYIHQNPLRAGLVTSYYDWPYSSWLDFMNLNSSGIDLVAKYVAMQLFSFSDYDDFFEKSIQTIDKAKIAKIWNPTRSDQ
jgi:REP element-mobilizing transposase RayT